MPSEIPRRVCIQGPGFVLEAAWNAQRAQDAADMVPLFERVLRASIEADGGKLGVA